MHFSNRKFWMNTTGYYALHGVLEVGIGCVKCTPAIQELFFYEGMLASLRQTDPIWLMGLEVNCFNPSSPM